MDLIFKPVSRFNTGGDEIQVCTSNYKGVEITWRTIFFWNIFKNPKDIIVIDLVLPMNTNIENGIMSDVYYTDEGYGLPEFNSINDAMTFIDQWTSRNG